MRTSWGWLAFAVLLGLAAALHPLPAPAVEGMPAVMLGSPTWVLAHALVPVALVPLLLAAWPLTRRVAPGRRLPAQGALVVGAAMLTVAMVLEAAVLPGLARAGDAGFAAGFLGSVALFDLGFAFLVGAAWALAPALRGVPRRWAWVLLPAALLSGASAILPHPHNLLVPVPALGVFLLWALLAGWPRPAARPARSARAAQ